MSQRDWAKYYSWDSTCIITSVKGWLKMFPSVLNGKIGKKSNEVYIDEIFIYYTLN